MKFNEDTRVKIPAATHLTRLGYNYISLKNKTFDKSTNIFTDIFIENIVRINKAKNTDYNEKNAQNLLKDINLLLDYEDLGKEFYKKLSSNSGEILVDFENFENNSFHVVTELTFKNDEDEFRPDITLLINGMPLAFIEVKKPNNKDGIYSEINRINVRSQNKKFRKFFNLIQIMVFSNNMPYNSDSTITMEGAFYATSSNDKPKFHFFREKDDFNFFDNLIELDQNTEDFILKDNNYQVIKHNVDYILNKEPDRPTNKILTSLFLKERLAFILKFGIAYVDEFTGTEKHIMRYPQIFATKAIAQKLDEGIKKGIIWHTQGSGKTALAFYNVKFLTDFFQKKQITAKFYFIVDRIDLLVQAKKEFSKRGLKVVIVNSKQEFVNELKAFNAISNLRGELEITVVNIQKFSNDANVTKSTDYDINIQRVYFLDEVHRSYNPQGSFLSNLFDSDKNSIKIGLTGTPLLNQKIKIIDKKENDVKKNLIQKIFLETIFTHTTITFQLLMVTRFV